MAGSHRARLAVFGAIGLVVALAAAVVGGVVAMPAAHADGPIAWSPAPCVTGAFTDVREDRDGPPVLWISGWMRPCAAPLVSNEFHAIWYYDVVPKRGQYRWRYESPSEPTSFSLRIATPGGAEPTAGLTAVCVADDWDRKIACVALGAAAPGELPAVTPIPTDDPRVGRVPSVPRPGEPWPDPICGTCL